MAKVEFELVHGVEIGGQLEKRVVLRELTAGDIIGAGEESERLVYSPEGKPMMMQSPVRMGVCIMCRQIEKLGSINGPIEVGFLEKLHEGDFVLLQNKCDELSAGAEAGMGGLADRGRSAGDSEGD